MVFILGYFLPEDISVHNVSIRSIFISWKMIKGAVKYEVWCFHYFHAALLQGSLLVLDTG